MTPVIIATHTDGVVRIFTRTDDGTVRQTGRFVVDQIEPPALAALVADLADTFHWNGTPQPEVVKTVKVVKDRPKDYRSRPRAGKDVVEQRRQAVIDHLDTHGSATAIEVGVALFSTLPDPTGKARKVLDQLTATGTVTRVESTQHGTPMQFRIRPTDELGWIAPVVQ